MGRYFKLFKYIIIYKIFKYDNMQIKLIQFTGYHFNNNNINIIKNMQWLKFRFCSEL